jgi:hypothetical protein
MATNKEIATVTLGASPGQPSEGRAANSYYEQAPIQGYVERGKG